MIWQMMMAMLHSNRQQRTEMDGDTEEGCQKPAVQQKTTDDDNAHTYIQTQSQIKTNVLCVAKV